ncbi:MAG TPA: hypothetical protein VH393_10835, partial [Ktedonobacterales bacterium]
LEGVAWTLDQIVFGDSPDHRAILEMAYIAAKEAERLLAYATEYCQLMGDDPSTALYALSHKETYGVCYMEHMEPWFEKQRAEFARLHRDWEKSHEPRNFGDHIIASGDVNDELIERHRMYGLGVTPLDADDPPF